MLKVTIWNEYPHGQDTAKDREAYPQGLHNCIRDFLSDEETEVKCALFDQPEYGLSDDLLNNTDVLIWWAHVLHDKIPDILVKHLGQGGYFLFRFNGK